MREENQCTVAGGKKNPKKSWHCVWESKCDFHWRVSSRFLSVNNYQVLFSLRYYLSKACVFSLSSCAIAFCYSCDNNVIFCKDVLDWFFGISLSLSRHTEGIIHWINNTRNFKILWPVQQYPIPCVCTVCAMRQCKDHCHHLHCTFVCLELHQLWPPWWNMSPLTTVLTLLPSVFSDSPTNCIHLMYGPEGNS